MAKLFGTALVAAGLSLASSLSHAATYDALYVFGDSLSDRGNLAETGVLQAGAGQVPIANYPNPPSNHDSFTNGPVAVSLLANSFGLTADPSLWVTGFKDVNNLFGGAAYVPGTNYAVAGATAQAQAVGGPPSINLPQQIGAYNLASSGKADPKALYTVFIGGNDVRNAALQGTGATAITAAVQAELLAISTLVSEGARNLLVVNVPNVGVIPEFAQDAPNLAGAATSDSQLYDMVLSAGLASAAEPTGTQITAFDLYGFNSQIAADASQLGFTNTTDRCFTNTPLSPAATAQCGPNGANVNQFLYWDSIHPSAPVHALWAQGFEAALAGNANPSPVPEPATVALLAASLAGLTFVRRRTTPRG